MTCLQSQRSGFLVSAATVLATLVALQTQASGADKDGKKLSGTVVKAADGSPGAGATVYLLRRTSTLPHPSSQTRSDTAGRFTFEDVQPGTYRLFAESGNQISSRQWGASSSAQSLRLKAEQVTVSSNEVPRPMTLRLVEGCRFRVSVKRAADNRPIANAKIQFPGERSIATMTLIRTDSW
jgi:5-hydroxyisourate hydrolase-like protein (transthyretin family)